MHTKKGTAFVLKRQDWEETGSLLTLFSLEYGLFRAIAQGARKEKNKWRNAFSLFNRIEFECASTKQKTSFNKIIRVHQHQEFGRAESFAFCAVVAEVLIRFCPDGQAIPRLFNLVQEAFRAECKATFVLIFLVKFFSILGLFPDFSVCSHCAQKFSQNSAAYWRKDLLCVDCVSMQSNLNFTELKTLYFFQRADFNSALCVKLSPSMTNKLFNLVLREMREYSTKTIKSLAVLEEMAV